MGDWYGAVSELEIAAQIGSDDSTNLSDTLTCFDLTNALEKDDQPREAIAQSVRCADSMPPSLFATLAFSLALSMSQAGDADYAETVCQEAILAEPNKPEGFECLGRVSLDSARLSRAVAAFRAALRFAPDDPSLHHYLGQSLDATGEKEQALEEFRRAVQLNPDSPIFKGDYERALGAHKN